MDNKKTSKKGTINCLLCGGGNTIVKCKHKGMTIYCCKDCKMMFQDPRSDVVSRNQFNDPICNNYNTKKNLKHVIAKDILERIEACSHIDFSQARVLEIGAGSGVLASIIMSKGAYYKGVEPSGSFSRQALSNFPDLEAKLEQSVESKRVPKNFFDLIIMIDTLEHILCPVDFLIKLKQYLRNDGLIYIEIPSESFLGIKGFLRKLFGVYSGYITHPGHVSLFVEKTFKKIVKNAGFIISYFSYVTILGDYNKLRLVFNEKNKAALKCIALIFKLIKADLFLRQGSMAILARKN